MTCLTGIVSDIVVESLVTLASFDHRDDVEIRETRISNAVNADRGIGALACEASVSAFYATTTASLESFETRAFSIGA